MSDLAARWSGVVIAAFAAIMLLLSGFVSWWGTGPSAISGWGAFAGPGTMVLAAAVAAGLLLIPTLGLRPRLARALASVLAGTALGAALLIVWHLAVQTDGLFLNVGVTAGAPLAAGSCLAVAGAATVAAHGTGLGLERVRSPSAARALIATGCVGLIVSLWLPWASYARAGEAGPRLSPITLTGWHVWNGAAWCLLLDAAAILIFAALARRPPRVAVGGLAAAGWLATAITVAIPPRAVGATRLPFGVQRLLIEREAGFDVALGCAAAVVLLGLILIAASVATDGNAARPPSRDDARDARAGL